MIIKVNKDTKVPLYIQVKKQIMDLIKNGTLKVGSKMPTERELAEQLKVSRNTISTAYSYLEQEGVLKSYQGRGTFVAEEAKPWKAQNIKNRIIKFVDLAFEEALEAGIDGEEFLELVTQRINEKQSLMKSINSIYIECNIEQAKMFSKQLEGKTHMNVTPLTLNDLKNMDKGTVMTIENSQVIITTFNHVNEVKDLIQDFHKEVLGIAINADLETIVKIARHPSNTKFAFICISEEFMFKISDALEKAGLGNIDIVYSNTDDKDKLKEIVDKADTVIVSPGRYKDVRQFSKDKEIFEFLFSLDDGSVKALKSKLIELKEGSD